MIGSTQPLVLATLPSSWRGGEWGTVTDPEATLKIKDADTLLSEYSRVLSIKL
jgi:hypothetical protein